MNNISVNGWLPINTPRLIPSLPPNTTEDSPTDGSMASQMVATVVQEQEKPIYITPPRSPNGKSVQKPRTPLPTGIPPGFKPSIYLTSSPTKVERLQVNFEGAVDNIFGRGPGETNIAAVKQTSEEEAAARRKLEALFPPKQFWQPSDTELKANGKKVERTGDIAKIEGHANAWASTLGELGLTAGDWPKEKLELPGMALHEGKANSKRRVVIEGKTETLPICELPFIMYHILYRAPGRMLLLDQLFNITLAVVPNLNPKNASFRHCLSTHLEFKNLPKDEQGRTMAGWTIATAAEFQQAQSEKRAKDAEKKVKKYNEIWAQKSNQRVNEEYIKATNKTFHMTAKKEDVESTSNKRLWPEDSIEETAHILLGLRRPVLKNSRLRCEIFPEDLDELQVGGDESSRSLLHQGNDQAVAQPETSSTEDGDEVHEATSSSNKD